VSSAGSFVRAVGPGLLLAIGVAAIARLIGSRLTPYVSDVTIAVVVGLLVGRLPFASGPRFGPGLKFSSERLLRTGIVLIGAQLGLAQIAGIGLPAAAIVAVTMIAVLALVLGLGRVAAIDRRLAVLLAVGAAVCGNSAAVATAPIINARPRDLAYAVATITLFGTAAVLVYPFVGRVLGLGDGAFGLWSGIAINDTSQVVAAGSAYSPAALEVATVVKLIRNALMAPLLIAIAWVWSRRTGEAGDPSGGVRRAFPVFVLGFLTMAGLRSVGVIGPELAAALEVVARALILVALAAMGLAVRFGELRAVGLRPSLVGLGAAVIVGVTSLALIVGFGLAVGGDA
jgi:uncharacterized integral membrane protein (TIGR00698 family)